MFQCSTSPSRVRRCSPRIGSAADQVGSPAEGDSAPADIAEQKVNRVSGYTVEKARTAGAMRRETRRNTMDRNPAVRYIIAMRSLFVVPIITATAVLSTLLLYIAWSLSLMSGRSLFDTSPNRPPRSVQPDTQSAPAPSPPISSEEQTESADNASIELSSPRDDLEISQHIPSGMTYDEVRRLLPGLSELQQGEGISAAYATMPTDILGYPFVLTIDFRESTVHDVTYSYSPDADYNHIMEVLEAIASYLESDVGDPYIEPTTTETGNRLEYYRLIGGSVIVDATVVSTLTSSRLSLHIRSQ